MTLILLMALVLAAPSITASEIGAATAGELAVVSDFPGGSAKVEAINQQQRIIRVHPASGPGWDCWWYFQVTGIEPGETLTLDVGGGVWATPERAVFSTDGKTWQQTAPGKREGQRIVYRQTINARQAWFAWEVPFLPKDATALVKQAAERAGQLGATAEAFTLCKTRQGRPVPALRLAPPGGRGEARYGIWIQARQHAWEAGSSHVAAGLVAWLISDDPRAQALRREAEIVVVPIMDIDNVVRGAGGKNQQPHDHNRDWTDAPHWQSVAAAQNAIRAMNAAGRFDLFLDLHNPDANSRQPYFYISPKKLLSQTARQNLDRFLAAVQQEMTGPLKFTGQVKASGSDYDKRWRAISKNWAVEHTDDHVVAVTLETPWNTSHSTPAGYRQVGWELGLAIERYLRQ